MGQAQTPLRLPRKAPVAPVLHLCWGLEETCDALGKLAQATAADPSRSGCSPPAPARRARRGRQCRPRVLTGCKHSLSSQVIVVWVGTNNHDNTAEEVAGGIEAIVRLINSQQPQAKVIVLVRAKDGAPARPVSSAPGGAGGHQGGQRCLSPLRGTGLPAVILSPFPGAVPLSLLAMV